MRRVAISSWSLDGALNGGLPLLDVPAAMAAHGIGTLELCHFHLPSTDAEYLAAFRQALAASGIELYSVLIDTGDLVSPDPARQAADHATIAGWLPIAAALGASRVRIDAGLQAPDDTIVARSAAELRGLAEVAATHGLQVITENWHATSLPPEALNAILDRCAGTVGLCADTGNAEATADKYATLEQILPRASSIHFKACYDADGAVNAADAERCAALINAAGFDGVLTLIYGDKRDEWAHIEQLRATLQPLLG